MSTFDDVQKAIAQGNGISASILGQSFQVFRNRNLIIPSLPAIVTRSNDRKSIEAALSLRNLVLMELVVDFTKILPGDVLQGADPTDRYVIASIRPMKKVIAYRTETPVTIRRPNQPVQVTSPDNHIEPYSGIQEAKNYWLTYTPSSNTYAFQDPTTSGISEIQLYAGLSQINYTGSETPFKLPTDTRTTRWVFVIELLNGAPIVEGDHIRVGTDNYEVYGIDTQIAGFHGQILSCDKKRP
jgi:hypothetical protein